jgi:hypothetical protein
MGKHYIGMRLEGEIGRFSRQLSDEEFDPIAKRGLPPGFLAWHLEDDEDTSNSDRCRLLRKRPLVVAQGGSFGLLSVGDDDCVCSPFPLADPIAVLESRS